MGAYNMGDVFFTVIIAVYNVERYLLDCLESISKQTYTNFEIIAIDDCSNDNSLSILKNYEDDRLRVFRHETNKGQGAARNLGIRKALGRYILFVDSDDLIQNDTLEKLYKGFVSTNVDYIRFNATSFIDGDKTSFLERKYNFGVYLKHNKVYEKNNLKDIFYSFTASPVLQSFSKDLIKKNSIFFNEDIIHEDELFNTMLILNIENCLFIDEQFYFRRYRENSTMTNKTEAQIKKSFNSYIQILNIYENKFKQENLTNMQKEFLKYRINSVISNLKTIDHFKTLTLPYENVKFNRYYHKTWFKNVYKLKKLFIITKRKMKLY